MGFEYHVAKHGVVMVSIIKYDRMLMIVIHSKTRPFYMVKCWFLDTIGM